MTREFINLIERESDTERDISLNAFARQLGHGGGDGQEKCHAHFCTYYVRRSIAT